MEKEAIDWAKRVEQSGGTSVFLPDQFQAEFEEWLKESNEYAALSKKYLEELAEKQLRTDIKFQNLVLRVRAHFKDAGVVDAFTKDFGMDQQALEENKFIINFTDTPRRA